MYFIVALFQATIIIALAAISTGTISALYSPLTNIDRITPFPAPASTPTGPFNESTHPSIGSLSVGITTKKM